MNNLCTEIGHVGLNKFSEYLCGDHVETVAGGELPAIVVLADGLGSGVKANILSTLTAKIISTMLANSLELEDCVATVAATLPICHVRQIAYSTFSIIRILDHLEAELIQFDNPHIILLRGGKNFCYPTTSEVIDGKTIHKTKIQLKEDDTFIAISDGAVHAGIGHTLNFGWGREHIIEHLESIYKREISAKTFSAMLLGACNDLYGEKPGDDTTVCVLKIRRRQTVNLLFGPPTFPGDCSKMMALFFSKQGKHIVCGGTTSTIAASFLNKELDVSASQYLDPDIPPTAEIEGVDLVTEGVSTMTRVLEYAKDFAESNTRHKEWQQKEDGASRIARLLFEEATDINFYVGKAINPAHPTYSLPSGLSIKMHLVEVLSTCLSSMGKKIKVSYF